MAYTFPKRDFKKEVEEEIRQMEEARRNGEFDDITGDLDDIDDSMTIEEALDYLNNPKYSNASNYTEEDIQNQNLGDDQKNILRMWKALYEKAENTLKEAGKL